MGIEEENVHQKNNLITDIKVDLPASENSLSLEKKNQGDIDLYREEFMGGKPKIPGEQTKKNNQNNPFTVEEDNQSEDLLEDPDLKKVKLKVPESEDIQFDELFQNGTKEVEEILKKRRNLPLESEYYLFFHDDEYNHKFFLVEYQLFNEELLLDRIQKLISYVRQHDPQLVMHRVCKYENFKTLEDQKFQFLSFDEVKPDNIGIQIIMLVQTSEKFRQVFGDQVPKSQYQVVQSYETTVSPVYKFDREIIETDVKWKVLSRTAEIFVQCLFDLQESVRIYEIRSTNYF